LFSSCGVELAHPAKSMITDPTMALNTAFCPIVVNHPFPRERHLATFLAHPTLRPPKRSTVSVSLFPDPENVLRRFSASSQQVETRVRRLDQRIIHRSCATSPSSISFAARLSHPNIAHPGYIVLELAGSRLVALELLDYKTTSS
jgi:hypothetical protein